MILRVVYFLPIGELYATDPTFYGKQKQPLNEWLFLFFFDGKGR